ncbi:MAG: 30S ribosomal protein S4 [Patescibacteria group bacterium]
MKSLPRYKICRRVGDRIYGKCQTPAFSASLAKRAVTKPAGRGRGGKSDYGAQLTEKQKVRFTYGMTERQFSNYVESARETGGKETTGKLYQMLETRLDNVVFRLGFVTSRRAARQMVSHGHVLVNGSRVAIPSYHVSLGDVIKPREASRSKGIFTPLVERLKEYKAPAWLTLDSANLEGKVQALPKKEEAVASALNLQSIMEFYSR